MAEAEPDMESVPDTPACRAPYKEPEAEPPLCPSRAPLPPPRAAKLACPCAAAHEPDQRPEQTIAVAFLVKIRPLPSVPAAGEHIPAIPSISSFRFATRPTLPSPESSAI